MSPSGDGSLPSAAQLVDRVPLIKNPAFWVPPPVQPPLDVHPLPDNVEAYFVYPHTLEAHVLSTLPATLAELEAKHTQHVALLESYTESKERARKAKLLAIAPGWNEGGEIMQPVRKETRLSHSMGLGALSEAGAAASTTQTEGARSRDDRDEGPSTPTASSLLGGQEHGSPREMGQATLEQLDRDQMKDWFDKWDGGGGSGGVASSEAEAQLI